MLVSILTFSNSADRIVILSLFYLASFTWYLQILAENRLDKEWEEEEDCYANLWCGKICIQNPRFYQGSDIESNPSGKDSTTSVTALSISLSLSHLLFVLYFSHSISHFLLSYSVCSFFFVFSLFFLSFLSLFSPIILSFCFSSLSLSAPHLLWIHNLPIYFFNSFCFRFTNLMQWISILDFQQIWVLLLQSNLKWEKFVTW